MARAIYTCRSKACRAHWAFDYPITKRSSLGYGRFQSKAYRQGEYRLIEAGFDHVCPTCGTEHARANMVRGFTTDHVCDERCTSATGSRCECACGGKNHGGNFLCEAA